VSETSTCATLESTHIYMWDDMGEDVQDPRVHGGTRAVRRRYTP
jgi:hypothetical protein